MLFFLSFGFLVNGFWMEVLVTIPYSLSIFFPSPRQRLLWEFGMQPYPFESKIRLENGRCMEGLDAGEIQKFGRIRRRNPKTEMVCTHFHFPFLLKKCREIELLLEHFLVKLLGPKLNSRGELKKKKTKIGWSQDLNSREDLKERNIM